MPAGDLPKVCFSKAGMNLATHAADLASEMARNDDTSLQETAHLQLIAVLYVTVSRLQHPLTLQNKASRKHRTAALYLKVYRLHHRLTLQKKVSRNQNTAALDVTVSRSCRPQTRPKTASQAGLNLATRGAIVAAEIAATKNKYSKQDCTPATDCSTVCDGVSLASSTDPSEHGFSQASDCCTVCDGVSLASLTDSSENGFSHRRTAAAACDGVSLMPVTDPTKNGFSHAPKGCIVRGSSLSSSKIVTIGAACCLA
eukprot:CAMPEP_0203889866 /NCGR_PEP_ID=MMETSP0359-20131031/33380_1 /ASSEMBLY_ACC=CAM_ASM_000338 /TAXON_ID=268821 /ORGANISM="Scrippsiella Hangoei, Strain SHTV-5" /LENGTH=255 /DNA_ID=CAMNT_0050811369 /DNA_START=623 /DNA_END=1390 /DNA_ORIENTATION=+